ncbi:MAG: DUF4157 domain-containing protein, partial [Pseudomonadota bacterium]
MGLTMGTPDDRFEREAEEIANRVVGMDGKVWHGPDTSTAGKVMPAPQVQRLPSPAASVARKGNPSPSRIDLGGPGQPLARAERRFFERQLGAPLDHVRIHDGMAAAAQANRLHARAFTHGSHIAFAPGAFRPGSQEGRRLLAHELIHVLQQQGGEGPALQRAETPDRETYVDPCEVYKTARECVPRVRGRGHRALGNFPRLKPRICLTIE